MQSFCHALYVPEAGRPRSGVRGRLLAAGGVLGAGLVLGSAAPVAAEVAVTDGVMAMNDGGEELAVHLLDTACQVVDTHAAPVDPYDPEDMAVAADGTIWLADTRDKNTPRGAGAPPPPPP